MAEPIALDKDLFHVGHVVGEEGSHVHLSLHPAGGLDGVLRRADGASVHFVCQLFSCLLSLAPVHFNRRDKNGTVCASSLQWHQCADPP